MAATLLPFAVWVLLLPGYLFDGDRVTEDSASYIDCARSVHEGRGFLTRTYSGLGSRTWEPIRLWPPGYPILIAGAMLAGLKPYGAALAVSVVCSALFVLLVARLFAATLPLREAQLSSLFVVSMPPLLATSTLCWSEGAYILFTVSSLVCVIRATREGGRSGWWLFLGGLAGGFSWCIRNVSVALFAATLLFLGSQALRVGVRRAAVAAAKWGAGWIAASVWLLVRNALTFGAPNPYSMPASDVSFARNAATALQTIAGDLIGLGRFSSILVNRYSFVAACVLLLVLAIRFRKRLLRVPASTAAAALKRHPSDVLLTGFVLIYFLVIVAARTRWQWGEAINSRHFVPIYWALVLEVVSLAARRANARGRAALAVVLAAGAVIHAASPVNKLRRLLRSELPASTILSRAEARGLGAQIPADQIVLTDEIARLRIFGNINARRLPGPGSTDRLLTEAEIREAQGRGVLWGIVLTKPEDLAALAYGPAIASIISQAPQAGFTLRKLAGGTLVAQSVSNPPDAR